MQTDRNDETIIVAFRNFATARTQPRRLKGASKEYGLRTDAGRNKVVLCSCL